MVALREDLQNAALSSGNEMQPLPTLGQEGGTGNKYLELLFFLPFGLPLSIAKNRTQGSQREWRLGLCFRF